MQEVTPPSGREQTIRQQMPAANQLQDISVFW
jgi:hypothetical protein